MNFKPLKGRVVIKRDKSDESANGFFLPEAARERKNKGIVLAVADDVKDVKVGDHVMFGKYDGTDAGKDYVINGEEVLIMAENQIWAILS